MNRSHGRVKTKKPTSRPNDGRLDQSRKVRQAPIEPDPASRPSTTGTAHRAIRRSGSIAWRYCSSTCCAGVTGMYRGRVRYAMTRLEATAAPVISPAPTKSPTLVVSSLTKTPRKPTESYHHTSVSRSAAMPPTTTRASMTSSVVPSGPRRRRPVARGGPPDPSSAPSGRAEPSPGPAGPSNHSERLTALLVPPSGNPRVDRGEQCTPATCAAIGHHGPVTDAPQPVTDPLTLAALDTERHVARSGWDQPVRLFALVPTVVPPEAERELPEDDADALRVVAEHPGRADVRLLVAVTRDGSARCLLRQRGDDIAPGLVHALRATFSED